MINNFIEDGKIIRPTVCRICGRSDRPIQAHHPDPANKPLEVVWCCQECHRKLERGEVKLQPWMSTNYDYIRERDYWWDEDGKRHWRFREGHQVSEETRRGMSEARKRWWNRKGGSEEVHTALVY